MSDETPTPEFTPSGDPGADLMNLFVNELIRRLSKDGRNMTAAELNVVRQLLSDNSITLSRVKQGDFGKVAQAAAEDFPFDEDGAPVQ